MHHFHFCTGFNTRETIQHTNCLQSCSTHDRTGKHSTPVTQKLKDATTYRYQWFVDSIKQLSKQTESTTADRELQTQ